MKTIPAIALLAVASTLGAGLAVAQAHAVRATMPFDFTVGNKLLPPGTYTITQVLDDAIEIQNSDAHVAILCAASPEGQSGYSAKLVFDRYAGQYFLREVAGGPSAINVYVPTTKQEAKARSQEASLQTPTQVVIAANKY